MWVRLRRYPRTRIVCTWQSSLPGVPFVATGTLSYQPSAELREKGRPGGRAAARLALNTAASAITARHLPTQIQVAQEELALAFARWIEVKGHPHLKVKARITLRLSPENRARAQSFEDALREERLRQEIDRERLIHLRDGLFADPTLARSWWLDRQRNALIQMSWRDFNEKVLPSIGAVDDARSRAMRVAHVLAEVMEDLGTDPGRQQQFIETARVVLEQMGWKSTAEKLPLD